MDRLQETFDQWGVPLQEAEGGTKLNRTAFLYLEPKNESEKEDYAQCSSCHFFTGDTCLLHGKMEVSPQATCEFYVHGEPQTEAKGQEQELLTPGESGLIKLSVQCHRCASFDSAKNECLLFSSLNEKFPEKFNLEVGVHPHGCCNAFTD